MGHSKVVLLLRILFVILCVCVCVCLSCYIVCSLQSFGHLLGNKGLTSWLGHIVRHVFLCVFFATFPYGVLSQAWYLIVSISDFAFFSLVKCISEPSFTLP